MRTAKEKGGQRSIFARRRADHCPRGYYTSVGLCERVGISARELRSLAAAGMIAAKRYNNANCALYTEEQVQMLLYRQSRGWLFNYNDDVGWKFSAEDALKVFELLEKQTPLHHIVMETQLPPQVVKRIAQEYVDMLGTVTVPKTMVEEMNRLCRRFAGPLLPLRSATDILAVLRVAADDRICCKCERASCVDLCISCLRSRLTRTV